MILTPFEEMLGQDESTEIELFRIDAFPGHPFQVRLDEDMEKLIESIGQSGVIVPVILRKKQDGRYETIAGHRRCAACRQLGMDRIPAVIREMSEEEAVLCMIDSNIQRTCILPSEKAKAYRMKMEALSRQGNRKEADAFPTTSRQPVGKWKKETAEQIGTDAGDSGRQVQRYLRLNHLLPELLKLVDEKKLAFLSGVELSWLSAEQQEELFRYLQENPHGISRKQAGQLRQSAETEGLSPERIEQILSGTRPKKQKRLDKKENPAVYPEKSDSGRSTGFRKLADEIRTYFPKGCSDEDIWEILRQLLEKWKSGEVELSQETAGRT